MTRRQERLPSDIAMKDLSHVQVEADITRGTNCFNCYLTFPAEIL